MLVFDGTYMLERRGDPGANPAHACAWRLKIIDFSSGDPRHAHIRPYAVIAFRKEGGIFKTSCAESLGKRICKDFGGRFANHQIKDAHMKVLVSDNLGEDGIRMFQEAPGIDVDVKTGLEPDALKAIIADYDALVIRSATKVTEDLLQPATRLKVVGRAGIGLDNVDIPAATRRGVVVMNTPTGNVVTTAEHAIAMMLALTRNIPTGTASLRDGSWEKKKLQGREIFNKVLGVIGYGKIGSPSWPTGPVG
jgi:hypothetical protein